MTAKSRSGMIRQAIGPLKSRISHHISTSHPLAVGLIPDNNEDVQRSVEEIDVAIGKLTVSINSLQEKDTQWNAMMYEISTDDAIEQEEVLYQKAATSEDGYLLVVETAKELVSTLQVKRKTLIHAIDSGPTNNERAATDHQRNKCARLPKLSLLSYGGGVNWPQFWSLFESNVHNNEDLSKVEKFSYLTQHLHGEAFEAIEGIDLTDEGYNTAIAHLKTRFERTREEFIGALYAEFKQLPNASPNLQKTFDSIEKIFRQLKSHGEDIEANRSLVLDVLAKYPRTILTELSRRHQVGTHSTIGKVQEALSQYIKEVRSLSGMLGELEPLTSNQSDKSKSRSSSQQKHNPNRGNDNNSPQQTSESHTFAPSSALAAAEKGSVDGPNRSFSSSRPSKPCYFCEGDHFNAQCRKFSTIEERMKRLEALRRCTRCGGPNHSFSECRRRNISCYFCHSTNHVSSLCGKRFGSVKQNSGAVSKPFNDTASSPKFHAHQPQKSDSKSTPKKSTTDSACSLSLDERSLLSTAVTDISNPSTGSRTRVRLILDSGSHRSYIDEKLAHHLGLQLNTSERLSVAVFGSKRSLSLSTNQVRFQLRIRNGECVDVEAHTVPLITTCSLTPGILPENTKNLIETMPYAMADDQGMDYGPPQVLLGSDYFWEFISGPPITSSDGISLIPSRFGFILGGRYKDDTNQSHENPSFLCLTERPLGFDSETMLSAITNENTSLTHYPDVDAFWSLETIGITDAANESEDEDTLKQFNESVSFRNGRYHVSWPWKPSEKILSTNYQLAAGRLKSLAKRLSAIDPKYKIEYNRVISEQLEKGIIEKVPTKQLRATSNRVHYLPHHPVIRDSHATTKLRIVYDASAKCRKEAASLNECLYRGPVILPNLCSILLRFRLHAVGMVADIEKAFLQIALDESQRDVTRFLWFKDAPKLDANNTEVYRFTRVPFGIISSPFILGATLQHHLNTVGSATAKLISDNIYVDNVIMGISNDEQAISVYHEAKKIFEDAHMNLREWCSSSDAFHNTIPVKDQAKTRTTKVLGLRWDSRTDKIGLYNDWKAKRVCNTKREALQAIASIYDPLGIYQPTTLAAKCFMRKLWNQQMKWDEQFNDDLQTEWAQIHINIAPIFDLEIPRRIHLDNTDDVTIVAFSDASMEAYATTIYLRAHRSDDTHRGERWLSTLVFSKSRLTPKHLSESISLPKLELLGLTIAAKAAKFVRESFQLPAAAKCILFCDSLCVLRWIRSDKALPRFIENRINQIRAVDNGEFRYVRSKDNPADIATRGCPGTEIANNSMWWHGPVWLRNNEDDWPNEPIIDMIHSDALGQIEVKTTQQPVFHLLAGEDLSELTYPVGINPSRFSSFRRLLRVSLWCLKFMKRFIWQGQSNELRQSKTKLAKLFGQLSDENHATAQDLSLAKEMWITAIQANRFGTLKKAIIDKGSHKLIKQLNVQLDDDGLLRCNGRLKYADLPPDAVRPKLLPKNDAVTNLIIKDAHEKLFHAGTSHTLSQLRREFWLLHGRNSVRKVINRCLFCRKLKGPPFALPAMPPWPRERLCKSAPFQFTGVDYLGPINVSIVGNVTKMWVALFTCFVTRAIHLECITDCTANCFIDCLSRFISRRGSPEQIISDNAPQFRLAKTLMDRTWQAVLTDQTVTNYISSRGINWKFTTELAPWQGGLYERLVGIVKTTFRVAVGRKLLKWTEFITLIAEVEAVVNSRPLTYVYSDIQSARTLRPMDFIVDQHNGTPDVDTAIRPEGGDAGKCLLRHWKYKQARLQSVWNVWYKEYLLSMRERGQIHHRGKRSELRCFPAPNEIVIVKNTDTPRGAWKLGKVLRTFPSRDGAVRSVELQLPNKMRINRPINLLYPLEIPAIDSNSSDTSPDNDTDEAFDGFTDADIEESSERLRDMERIETASTDFIDSAVTLAAAKDRLCDSLSAMAVSSSM